MDNASLILDAKELVNDLKDTVQTWTTTGNSPTSWQVLIGQPFVTQELDAGGYTETLSHEVRFIATASAWTTDYGASCAATLSSGLPVSSLAIGKVLVATEQGNRRYRINAVGFKPGTAWVVLRVRAEDER
jgi:hypothetical protein